MTDQESGIENAQNAKIKILAVEDNDFVRMQIVKFLKDAGYTVEEAARGDHAIEMLDGTHDVAIVDVRMEPVDGFEFIRSVRGLEMDLAVILVTGDQNPDLLNEAAKWGVAATLMKPVQKERLIKMIERTMRGRQK